MGGGLDDGLAAVLGETEIGHLARLSGGASRETWRFEADGRRLILQRQREGDVRDMTTEIAAIRAASTAGVPTATIVAASTDAALLGASFVILSDAAGETTPPKILRDAQYERARAALPAQLAEALVKVHAIDPSVIPGLADVDQVTQYREVLDTLGQPHPAFELALRWLDGNRPPSVRRGVVHGDFRLGNVIVADEGLQAVLDWELVHIGDPVEDLGWLCVKAGGRTVDPGVVRWWEVLGTMKWGIMCIMQANAHRTGVTRSHKLAAIGRRCARTNTICSSLWRANGEASRRAGSDRGPPAV